MPLTYTTNEDARPIVATLVKLFYPEIARAEVTFDILECTGGLKLHGYGAAAIIKPNSLKDRVSGLSDCRILLNAEEWAEADKKRRQAILDHELYHVDVLLDDEGKIQADDIGRPRIKMKPHDFQIGGFTEVIERNREHALEAQHFAFWEQKLRQVEFDWAAADTMAMSGSEEPAMA